MRISRFYIDTPSEFSVGETLPLSKEQAHYALTVLRLKNERPVKSLTVVVAWRKVG